MNSERLRPLLTVLPNVIVSVPARLCMRADCFLPASTPQTSSDLSFDHALFFLLCAALWRESGRERRRRKFRRRVSRKGAATRGTASATRQSAHLRAVPAEVCQITPTFSGVQQTRVKAASRLFSAPGHTQPAAVARIFPQQGGSAAGIYNPADFAHLSVTPDIQEVFSFIGVPSLIRPWSALPQSCSLDGRAPSAVARPIHRSTSPVHHLLLLLWQAASRLLSFL